MNCFVAMQQKLVLKYSLQSSLVEKIIKKIKVLYYDRLAFCRLMRCTILLVALSVRGELRRTGTDCALQGHPLQYSHHFVPRDWRKTAATSAPRIGGYPPGSVGFQKPCAWAARMERSTTAVCRSPLHASRPRCSRLRAPHSRPCLRPMRGRYFRFHLLIGLRHV